MAYQLRLTDGTNTLFTFSDGVNCIIQAGMGESPALPTEDVAWVEEVVPILLMGGLTTIQNNMRTINRTLADARYKETARAGGHIYLEKSASDTDGWWRAKIRGGELSGYSIDQAIRTGKMLVQLTVERVDYWEGALTSVTVSNRHGTNATGLTVYNHMDGDADNYVQLAANQITGDLPTPALIELTNLFAGNVNFVWIGHKFTGAPATFSPVYEGEAAIGKSGTTYTDASNGRYEALQAFSGITTQLLTWTLSTAQMDAAAGGWFHVFVRLASASAFPHVTRFELALTQGAGRVWASGTHMPGDSFMTLYDLFLMRLPPWLPGATGSGSLTMELLALQASGATAYYNVDYVYLMPADGFRHYRVESYAIGQNQRLVDNGPDDEVYRDAGNGTGKIGNVIAAGDPIMLRPGKLQRLYFLVQDINGNSQVARTASAKISYRPRRRDL
jgi:hypothetical protein